MPWYTSSWCNSSILALENLQTETVNCLLKARAQISKEFFNNKKFSIYLNRLLATNNKNLIESTYLIHSLAENDCIDLLSIILEQYPELLNQKDALDRTPVCCAASKGHEELVDYLINLGADLNIKRKYTENEKSGKSPLHCAIKRGHSTVANQLINAGAELSYTLLDSTYFRAHLAKLLEENNEPVLENLRNAFSITAPNTNNFFHVAAAKGWIELLKIFLNKHPELINQKDEFNQTLLVWAASKGKREVVEYLISLNADLDHSSFCPDNKSAHGKTALAWAVQNDHNSIADCLLTAGANIDESLLRDPKYKAYRASKNNGIFSSMYQSFFAHRRDENYDCCLGFTALVQ